MRVARDAWTAKPRPLYAAGPRAGPVDLEGVMALPGLINAHDHLEFALFPRLGQGPYRNAREWAEAIYRPSESPIREHLAVSKADRLLWGGLRNLFGGVTTVCHHNPYEPDVFGATFPVRVAREVGWAHSLAFADDAPARFAATPQDRPFVLHAAEGVDQEARDEIARLDAMGLLKDRTVLVHATACGQREWELLRARGCGVVWCPGSNAFLFGRALSSAAFESGVPIALGTDSPLTAIGSLFDELACARASGIAADSLYRMVTDVPARLLRLPVVPADWIGLRDRGASPCETLLAEPELEIVVVAGEVKLLSERLAALLPDVAHELSALRYGDRVSRVRADVPQLLARARAHLGDDIRLGGVDITEADV
jgi:cytosine/adenosine deaminase-related metal-dependent hydrolase